MVSFEGQNGANVDVSVAETDLGSTTADDGFFIVSGVPPGNRQMVFARGGARGTLGLNVPPKSTIDLQNVRVRDGEAEADEIKIERHDEEDDLKSGEDEGDDHDSSAGSDDKGDDHGSLSGSDGGGDDEHSGSVGGEHLDD